MKQQYFEEKLKAQLTRLSETAAVAGEAAQTVELDQSKVGRLSRMDALQQQAMSKEQNRRRTLQIKKIQAALQRMHQDEYGFCLDCGEAIKVQRLEIDPATPFCIACADKNSHPGM